MTEENSNEALHGSSSLVELLKEAGFCRVVLVDDEEASTELRDVSPAELIDEICALSPDALEHAMADGLLEGIPISLDEFGGVHRGRLEKSFLEAWEALGSDERSNLEETLGLHRSDAIPGEGVSIGPIAELLKGVLGSEIDFDPISVGEWEKYIECIDVDSDDDLCNSLTLVLMDLNLEKCTSCSQELRTPTGGYGLARKIAKKFEGFEGRNPFVVAIFTSTVSNTTLELNEIREKFDEGLPVAVIGKFRLSEAELAEGMKMALFISSVVEAHRVACESFASTQESLETFLANFSLKELLATAKGAEEEGAFPGEYYARVLTYEHMYRTIEEMRTCASNSLKCQMFDVASDFSFPHELIDSDMAAEIESTNAYLSQGYLLKTTLPIDIGDVFKIETETDDDSAYYMLLEQPCGVAVRSGSSKPGERNAKVARVVRLVLRSEKAGKTGSREIWRFDGLPPLVNSLLGDADAPSKKVVADSVDFRDIIIVDSELLDLCVFDECGQASFNQNISWDRFPVERAWKFRANRVRAWAETNMGAWQKILSCVAPGADEQWEETQSEILRAIWGAPRGQIKVWVDAGQIAFGISRVARLRSEYSYGALVEYARYHSRPARPGSLISRKRK